MKILLITDWNRAHGGAEAYVGWLRDGFIAAGDDLRILTSSAGSAAGGSADYVAFGTERRALQSVLQIANPFALATLRRALREHRPEVVVVNMFALHLSPVVLLACGAVPIVLLASDYKLVCPIGSKLRPDGTRCEAPMGTICRTAGCVGGLHWLRDQPRYALVRRGVRGAAAVVACSRFVAERLRREGIEAMPLLLPVPPPGEEYRRAPAADPTFLFCGRLDAEKGVALLLRAFATVVRRSPTARLRIAGRGPLLADSRGLARELGIEPAVAFLGWLDPTGVERELARAWALVAPSLWAEPLGLVAPEAIVRGVPVIASAEGGFAETVEEGSSGLLFANGDEKALAARLLAIAEQRAFPSRTVDPAVTAAAIERHSPAKHVAALRGILADVVSRGTHGRPPPPSPLPFGERSPRSGG